MAFPATPRHRVVTRRGINRLRHGTILSTQRRTTRNVGRFRLKSPGNCPLKMGSRVRKVPTMSTDSPGWTIEVEPEYERAVARELTAYQQEILDAAVRGVLAVDGTAVCRSQWGKALGHGLYEFRV